MQTKYYVGVGDTVIIKNYENGNGRMATIIKVEDENYVYFHGISLPYHVDDLVTLQMEEISGTHS